MTPPFTEILPSGAFSAHSVVSAAFETGAAAVLIDRPALPDAFFDLRSGLAGDLAQRLTLYGLRAACVVPDLAVHPERFREFAREANRGECVRVFATRDDAVAWLDPSPAPPISP